jgi:hypothetical protein
MSDHNVKPEVDSGDSGYEKRDIKVGKVLFWAITATVMLVIVIIFSIDYFNVTREELVYEAVLRPESAALRELRAREIEELLSYAITNTEKGIYRIPIEQAMKLMAEEAFRSKTAETKKK